MNLTFPNSPFVLNQLFKPAGDQPNAIKKLVEGVNNNEKFQTLLGVTGSGKTFTIANVIAQTGKPSIAGGRGEGRAWWAHRGPGDGAAVTVVE